MAAVPSNACDRWPQGAPRTDPLADALECLALRSWIPGRLELVRTRNGLLPKLDLFITLGKTGYAESFGQSVHDIGDRNYDVLVGISREYPLVNREAR